MDKTSFIGIIIAIAAIGVGMVMKGVSAAALFNPAALLIIFAGTAAAVIIAFPMSTIKNVPTLFKIIFTQKKGPDLKSLINTFTEMSSFVRREGLLSLEQEIEKTEDPFLKSGLRLAVDGQSPDFIRDVLTEKVYAMEERHKEGASVFTQAGTYAPTLGVLGAVIGLIAALGYMEDTEALGHAIAAAFMATLFGIFSGYMLWHPFANKLKEKSKKEVQEKHLIIEGIVSITHGESPMVVRDKLGSFLSHSELKKLIESEGEKEENSAETETA
ncbi:flagellar motor stator protein MotA [Thalassorhabdus alkalitolerans]|uniref:Flagellar motor stator protein MotA n=1 Tax=Thalassorhabdus alkalitolerans TaxID=2282697 RepID=A0ABW0YKH5_9BACI|nr:flagellar motor stator protein MotA [Thalassobacillus sp. C254]